MATQTISKGNTTLGSPAAGDTFLVLEGGQSITGNMDYSGQNTSVLADISKAFAGNIGTASDPWKTAFSTALRYGGSGEIYFESNAADTETTALIQGWGTGHFHFVGAGSIATRFEFSNGMQTVGGSATITTARFSGNSAFSLLDTGAGPTVTTLIVNGANGYSQRPHTTVTCLAGRIVLDCDSAGGVNAHGTINAYGGHVVIKDSSTIGVLDWVAGTVDTSMISRGVTITDCNINMTLPGAQALLDHSRITFTNTPARIMLDGRPL